jgi:hypothetical protein
MLLVAKVHRKFKRAHHHHQRSTFVPYSTVHRISTPNLQPIGYRKAPTIISSIRISITVLVLNTIQYCIILLWRQAVKTVTVSQDDRSYLTIVTSPANGGAR